MDCDGKKKKKCFFSRSIFLRLHFCSPHSRTTPPTSTPAHRCSLLWSSERTESPHETMASTGGGGAYNYVVTVRHPLVIHKADLVVGFFFPLGFFFLKNSKEPCFLAVPTFEEARRACECISLLPDAIPPSPPSSFPLTPSGA